MKIEEVHQGIKDKLEVYRYLKEKYGLQDEEIAYIGDDLNDLEIMEEAGVSFTVRDGALLLQERCDYCASKNGGEGAVREIIDLILHFQRVPVAKFSTQFFLTEFFAGVIIINRRLY